MKVIKQTINLNGFVSNIEIEPNEYLLPLQEVVVNAIQSIEDKNTSDKSSISINIIRQSEPILSDVEFEEPYSPIIGFEVIDNGVGFVTKRFEAFKEIYTDINKHKGCKGVGRFSVLACFNKMQVNSTYKENKSWQQRVFDFSSINGLQIEKEETNEESVLRKVNSTKVVLCNYKKKFVDYIIKKRITIEDITNAIIHHCLLYFLKDNMPLEESSMMAIKIMQ